MKGFGYRIIIQGVWGTYVNCTLPLSRTGHPLEITPTFKPKNDQKTVHSGKILYFFLQIKTFLILFSKLYEDLLFYFDRFCFT